MKRLGIVPGVHYFLIDVRGAVLEIRSVLESGQIIKPWKEKPTIDLGGNKQLISDAASFCPFADEQFRTFVLTFK